MISRFIKQYFIVFLFAMFVSVTAHAEEAKISPLSKGQVAPWSGVLFSNEAAAEVAATYSSIPERIKIEREDEKARCDAKCKKTVSDTIAEFDRKLSISSARVDSLTAEKKQLSELLREEEKKKTNTVLWTGLGFGSGVVLTIITVYAVSQATK